MRRQKKQYQKPGHPWQGERITEEKGITGRYGLKNKKEIWRAQSKLRNWRQQARDLVSLPEAERKVAQKPLFNRLIKLGLLTEKSSIDDILSLTVDSVLGLRLQTAVHRLNLAATVKQARQFITHGKIEVNGKLVTSPSFEIKSDDKVTLIKGFVPVVVKKPVPVTAEVAKEAEKEVEVIDG